jgi:hypothetical protein
MLAAQFSVLVIDLATNYAPSVVDAVANRPEHAAQLLAHGLKGERGPVRGNEVKRIPARLGKCSCPQRGLKLDGVSNDAARLLVERANRSASPIWLARIVQSSIGGGYKEIIWQCCFHNSVRRESPAHVQTACEDKPMGGESGRVVRSEAHLELRVERWLFGVGTKLPPFSARLCQDAGAVVALALGDLICCLNRPLCFGFGLHI